MEIRLATSDDARALAELRWEFRTALDEPVEPREAFVTRCTSWMAERLARRDTWRCWVAEMADLKVGATGRRGRASARPEPGQIVGNVWVQLIEKIPNATTEPERHAYVTNMYVRPTARGGVGSRLLGVALDWVRAADVATVILWPTARSRSLYARHGFAPPDDILAMSLAANRLERR